MDIAKEILAAARDIVEAGKIRKAEQTDDSVILVTAQEMEQYCPDCARQVANGEMEITRGELRAMLEDDSVLREVVSKLDGEDRQKISARRWVPGDRVEVVHGSGVDSGKRGTVVNRREVKTDGRGIPINVRGAYKQVDWNSEVAVRLDDGELITMFKERLRALGKFSESKTAYFRPIFSDPFRVGQTIWRISVDTERGTWRAEWKQGINWEDQSDWIGSIPRKVGQIGSRFLESQMEKASVGDRMAARKGPREDIAIKTLKMPEPMLGVMGGMTKEEAREYLRSIGYSPSKIRKLEV